MHHRRLATALLTASLLASACGGADDSSEEANDSSEEPGEFPMTVENCGEEVTIESRPERVLTVGGSALNLVVAAGGADTIVARAGEFGVAPAALAGSAAEDAEIIDSEFPSAEVILGADPDLVISIGLDEGANPEDLERAGISSIVVSGLCRHAGDTVEGVVGFDDVYRDLELYGQLFGTEERATETAADLKERAGAVEAQVGGDALDAAAIYFTGEGTPPFVFGSQSMINTQLETIGFENAFSDVSGQGSELNLEELIELDPDVIILTYGYQEGQTFELAEETLRGLPGAADLTAIQQDRIVGVLGYETEADQTAVDGLESLADELAATTQAEG